MVCSDELDAERAIQTLRGHIFFGKPLRLNFAKSQSDTIAKLRGQFNNEVYQKRKDIQMQRDKEKEKKRLKQVIIKLQKLVEFQKKLEQK